ncbi:MAG: nuclear transport factor 2 family protein [Acidimicrobiia bacterium]|nr:nuclear transport factor 2 family protein [Acidimicrobiia bacterium]
MVEPHPWEMPFDWAEFLRRWFEAIDAEDTATLFRFSCVDLVSERVDRTRLQRSRDGFVETLRPLWENGPLHHTWTSLLEDGPHAVVEWERSEDATGTVAHGISFLEIREGTGMLQLLRTYENPAARDGE